MFAVAIKMTDSFQLDQRTSTNYMEQLQQDITEKMRGILIDWIVEVCFITISFTSIKLICNIKGLS